GGPGHHLLADHDVPGRGLLQSGDTAQERGLPRPRGAEQGEELPVGHIERHLVQDWGRSGAEGLGHSAESDGGHGPKLPGRRRPAPVGTGSGTGVYPAPVRALTLVLAASLAACESPFVPPPPTTGTSGGGAAATLTLRPDSLRLFVDDTFSLIATVRDSQGQTLVRAVTWSVDDSSVAEVLSTGVLIALDSGHTMVRATADGLVDSTLIR